MCLCPGARLSSVCSFCLLIGPSIGRQERSCNYPAIVATIRKMTFCITNALTSHAVISFFIIPSVTFLCNGIGRVCLAPDGHRDAVRCGGSPHTMACVFEEGGGGNLVSVIQPCKTGAQLAALFATRLGVWVARWSSKPPLQVGFTGFGVQLEQLEQLEWISVQQPV